MDTAKGKVNIKYFSWYETLKKHVFEGNLISLSFYDKKLSVWQKMLLKNQVGGKLTQGLVQVCK